MSDWSSHSSTPAPFTRMDGMTRQRFLAVSLGASGAALVAAGCAGQSSSSSDATADPPTRPTGRLRVALAAAPQSLDPSLETSVAEIAIVSNVFDSLVAFSEDYRELVPELATAWRSAGNATRWTFTLRRGVRFHDGSGFDAEVAKANFDYILRPTNPYSFLLGRPAIDVVDEHTIALRYDQPFPDLLHNLTFGCGMSSGRSLSGSGRAREQLIGRDPVGCGPFCVASGQGTQTITVEAFDDYWGDTARLETIEFTVIPEESSRVSALQAGDVDLVTQVPPLQARALSRQSQLKTPTTASWTTVILQTVADQPPFDDVRVRRAAAHAIDREAIVRTLLLGEAVLDDSMFPPGIPGYYVPPTTYAYDPEKARALLKEAGHSGKVPIRLSTRADVVLASEVTQALAAQLDDAGFEVDADVLEISVFEADKARPQPRYQLHWGEWGWITGGPFHITLGAMAAQSKYSSPEYDRLVAEINGTADGPRRTELIRRAIDVWAEDAPWFTLWVPKRIDATVGTLMDYQTPPNVSTLLRRAYLA